MRTNARYIHFHTPLAYVGNIGTVLKYGFFASLVQSKGSWDLKRAVKGYRQDNRFMKFRGHKISPDNFGNIHYGYVGRAIKISLGKLKVGSWIANYWGRKTWGSIPFLVEISMAH